MQNPVAKLTALGAAAVLCIGCSAVETQAPTHRWAGNHAADSVQYHNDHAVCQAEAGIETLTRALDAGSPLFAAYKQCMTSRGYQLTAYRE